jgi:hypothetical protein
MKTVEKEGKRLKEECWCRRSHERKKPGTIPMARDEATDFSWFVVMGKKLLVREVSLKVS